MKFKPSSPEKYNLCTDNLYMYNGLPDHLRDSLSVPCLLQKVEGSDNPFNVLDGWCVFNNGTDKFGNLCAGLFANESDFTKINPEDIEVQDE